MQWNAASQYESTMVVFQDDDHHQDHQHADLTRTAGNGEVTYGCLPYFDGNTWLSAPVLTAHGAQSCLPALCAVLCLSRA